MNVIGARSTTTRTIALKRDRRLWWAAIFFGVAMLVILWTKIGVAIYAVSGFSWVHTNGTVTSSRTTKVPAIQFTTRDGSPVAFQEDYYLMCHRSFCLERHFDPGEVVPVVYDPDTPTRAYVYDSALFINAIEWFVVAALFVIFILLLVGVRLPTRFSIGIGRSPDTQ